MVFENIKNNILVFSKNYSYSLNLMFYVFLFFITKNIRKTCIFYIFLVLLVFHNKKQISKIVNKHVQTCFFFFVFFLFSLFLRTKNNFKKLKPIGSQFSLPDPMWKYTAIPKFFPFFLTSYFKFYYTIRLFF